MAVACVAGSGIIVIAVGRGSHLFGSSLPWIRAERRKRIESRAQHKAVVRVVVVVAAGTAGALCVALIAVVDVGIVAVDGHGGSLGSRRQHFWIAIVADRVHL